MFNVPEPVCRDRLLLAVSCDPGKGGVSGRCRSLHLSRGRLLPYVYHSVTLTVGIVSRGWPAANLSSTNGSKWPTSALDQSASYDCYRGIVEVQIAPKLTHHCYRLSPGHSTSTPRNGGGLRGGTGGWFVLE